MFEALKARGRAQTNGKARRTGAGRGKAAVSFAARLTFDDLSRRYAMSRLTWSSASVAALGRSTPAAILSNVDLPQPEGPSRQRISPGFALFPHLSILDNAAFGLRSLTRREHTAEA